MTSNRVGFRWWQADDTQLAMDLWKNPQVTRLFYKEPLTEEQVSHRLVMELESATKHHIQYWPIFLLEDGAHAGCAGLRYHSENKLEFGIHLKPEYWGCGLATEVGRRVIDHAFDNRLTNALFAGHHPQNKASRNALLKLGFIGATAQFYEPTGVFEPSYLLYMEPPQFSTRAVKAGDARALAIVHSYSIMGTFTGLLDDYVKARSLDYCEQRWEDRLAKNECQTIVLLRGEQIVGFASAAPSTDEDVAGIAGDVDRIYLHPSSLGAGHGNTLIKWCEETLKAQGFKTIKLWVFTVNERARRFYEKHGYEQDGCTKRDFDANLLRYSKSI